MNNANKNKARVADLVGIMENIAPIALAEEWDNCGLQVGDSSWIVNKIWVALDPLLPIVESAGHQDVDLVITHHPLIFNGLKRIDLNTVEGKVIASALSTQTALYAAHTNLDSAAEGINDLLAERVGLEDTIPLVAPKSSMVDEASTAEVGLGRIGNIAAPVPMKEWVSCLKKTFGLDHIKVAGNLDLMVRRVAVCSGSGGSLLGDFFNSDADVYVSGDLRYHDARAVEMSGRAFADIGHFASEYIIINSLVKKLKAAVHHANWNIQIEACNIETDPFEMM